MSTFNWFELRKYYRPLIELMPEGEVVTVEMETDNEIYYDYDGRWCCDAKSEEGKSFKYLFKGFSCGKKLAKYVEK